MTKKIFENDPYMKECSAIVQNKKIINGATWITLDQTIFYPEGGGQPSDFGFIDGVPVVDVQLIDNELLHKVDGVVERNRVKLHIDYERRFDHMQQHTGQHLLSAVWLELFGINTLSFHLGKDMCTIDLNANELNDEQIRQVELKVTQYIVENRPIENYILPYEEVEYDKLAKLKERPAFVRLIEIDGIDTSACCGTHVTMLGELGLLKIVGWEKYKQNVRLSFICGLRAYSYFQEVFTAVNEVSKKLNISPALVTERFPNFFQGYQTLKKNYQKLYEKEVHQEAINLINEATNNVVECSWEEKTLQEMKDLAKIIIEVGDKVVIFHNTTQKTWIFASSTSQLFNVSTCIKVLKESFGGKGGGNPVFGQWIGEVDDRHWNELKKQLLNE
ncbi:alanyl-tRNA editing protein [Anaerobacillus isosaccharinicus]|uniref:Alanyl-tRNA editing protein n=1 Tax=Anaerobacillus isosaccharinicus TaxID=1532552 RepID=A0A1S2M812_9BACI|nr:alanyl-tRNA editing protein [Anaerobacillus isosaccharinicus]MBA5587474.1 alanyl-tRNA editing protein [Anaerobacillus isosaccharinicus]QOY34343.1 alanyl-tRNA editing protein [Anaerobacillus isosaccharinicus]